MKKTVARSPLPLEKNPEFLVSWLVIGLAVLIFACHAGAAFWSASGPARLDASTPTEGAADEESVFWAGGLGSGGTSPTPAGTRRDVKDRARKSLAPARARQSLQSQRDVDESPESTKDLD